MVSTILLLLSLGRLESVDLTGNVRLFYGVLTIDGEVLGHLGGRLFHWSQSGSLIREIDCGEGQIDAVHYDGRVYWISTSRSVDYGGNKVRRGYSLFYNSNGRLINESRGHTRFINLVDGFMFTPLNAFNEVDRLRLDYHPFLVRWTDLVNHDGRTDAVERRVRLVRVPEVMRTFHFNFKRVWVAAESLMVNAPDQYLQDGGRFLVVNEIEPEYYIYDQEHVEAELLDPEHVVPSHTMNLPGFVRHPDTDYRIGKPTIYREYMEKKRNSLRTWSRIVWFGKYDKAYAVAYQIPGCEDGQCPFTVRIAILDSHLQATGDVYDKPEGWQVVGTRGGKIVLLQATDEHGKLSVTTEAVNP